MRLPLRKHPGVIVVAALLAGLLVWGFWPQPVLIETATVKRAPMTVVIEEEGRTRVMDRFVVSAPVDGVACRVQLDVGDAVQADQILLTISPLEPSVLDARSHAEAQARVAAAEAALNAARQQADAAQATADFQVLEVGRLRPLADRGVVSREAFDRAEMQLRTANAALRSASHNVDVAHYELEAARTALQYSAGSDKDGPALRVPVRSPVNGNILKLVRECEGPVRTGEALLEVGDPSQLEVEVDVLSPDAVRIRPGMPVLFERWGGEQALEGVVRVVEPVGFTKISALGVEEQRVLVITDITSPSGLWQKLGDGYRVEARFVIWREEDVLQIPASSLFRHDGGWALFAVEDDRARFRSVQVGQRNGLVAQILQGVAEGEAVIVHPSDEVEDGSRVTRH